jgi:hypothetical protein
MTITDAVEYLVLASYCGNDNGACTDARPCADCLAMCNVFDENEKFLRELGPALTIQGDTVSVQQHGDGVTYGLHRDTGDGLVEQINRRISELEGDRRNFDHLSTADARELEVLRRVRAALSTRPPVDVLGVLLRRFVEIEGSTEETGFDPSVEQALMDLAAECRAALAPRSSGEGSGHE